MTRDDDDDNNNNNNNNNNNKANISIEASYRFLKTYKCHDIRHIKITLNLQANGVNVIIVKAHLCETEEYCINYF